MLLGVCNERMGTWGLGARELLGGNEGLCEKACLEASSRGI